MSHNKHFQREASGRIGVVHIGSAGLAGGVLV
jgi:hypothetical protein